MRKSLGVILPEFHNLITFVEVTERARDDYDVVVEEQKLMSAFVKEARKRGYKHVSFTRVNTGSRVQVD